MSIYGEPVRMSVSEKVIKNYMERNLAGTILQMLEEAGDAIQERTISADAEQSLYLMYLKLTLMFRFRFNGIRKAWRGGERSEENQN